MGPATTKDPIECSLVDYAYREIRKRIQIGTYPPGSRLSTQEISTALGVSRTPVVAALNRLVAEGIAEAIPAEVFMSCAFPVKRSGTSLRLGS